MVVEPQAVAKQLLPLIDLTSLRDDETRGDIELLCQRAKTRWGTVAALCVYPRFIPYLRRQLQQLELTQLPIATVTNFPLGEADLDLAMAETRAAIAYGADEVDLVFPYRALLDGDEACGFEMVKRCKAICGNKTLKVIIESGELQTAELITSASALAIKAGADFIKTSTGKVATNATPEAARLMLEAIADHNPNCGFKAAGGIATLAQAATYLELAKAILGPHYLTPRHFRIGASQLLDQLTQVLSA